MMPTQVHDTSTTQLSASSSFLLVQRREIYAKTTFANFDVGCLIKEDGEMTVQKFFYVIVAVLPTLREHS